MRLVNCSLARQVGRDRGCDGRDDGVGDCEEGFPLCRREDSIGIWGWSEGTIDDRAESLENWLAHGDKESDGGSGG